MTSRPTRGEPVGEDRRGFVTEYTRLGRPSGSRKRVAVLAGGVAALLCAAAALGVGALNHGKSHTALASASRSPVGAKPTGSQSSTSAAPSATTGQGSVSTVGSAGSAGSGGSAAGGSAAGSGTGSIEGAPAPAKAAESAAALPAAAGSSPATTTVYQGVTGYGCPKTSSSGFDDIGYDDPGGDSEWYVVSSGGYTGSGCSGAFLAMPMSGTATVDDVSNFDEWWFVMPSSAAKCAVSTYTPASGNSTDVEGDPADYFVYDEKSISSSTPIESQFSVNQTENRGKWISDGTYPVKGAYFALRLVSRGIDYNSAGNADYHHFAVDAVMLACTS